MGLGVSFFPRSDPKSSVSSFENQGQTCHQSCACEPDFGSRWPAGDFSAACAWLVAAKVLRARLAHASSAGSQSGPKGGGTENDARQAGSQEPTS